MIVNESKNEVLSFNAISESRPLVVELVGPPGAGTTTLLRALCHRDKKILPSLRLRKTTHIPLFISNFFYWLPIFLFRHSHSRWFTRGELRSLTYLSGWPSALERQPAIDGSVTVFDHAPIFRLALLREFGPEMTKSRLYDRWWNRMLAQWANTLSLVIWLDASDDVLLQRICNRNRAHSVKGKHGPGLLCIEIEKQSPEQIADEVLAAIEVKRSSGGFL